MASILTFEKSKHFVHKIVAQKNECCQSKWVYSMPASRSGANLACKRHVKCRMEKSIYVTHYPLPIYFNENK